MVFNKSRNECCICVSFSIVNFIFGCLWFSRKTKKSSAWDSLFKKQMTSPTYLRNNITSHSSSLVHNTPKYSWNNSPRNNEDQRALRNYSRFHIFKHLNTKRNCKESCNTEFFETIDSHTFYYRLKLKEAMYITCEKPSLSKQVKYVSISLTI